MRGARIKNITGELGDEKIDIVRWNDSLQILVPNALQPAEVEDVILCPMLGRVIVLVRDDQLSLAIGKRGQNVRLASKLVGWDIEVMTREELDEQLERSVQAFAEIPGVTADLAENLVAQGFLSFDDLSVIEAAGLKPDALVITNKNHLREREAVVARWKIPTILHALESAETGITPDREVQNGDVVDGLVCVHLPGKSAGEIALYWPDRRLFLVGDALIAPAGRLKTVPVEKQADPAALKRSLETLRTFDFDHLLVGDGDPLLGDAKTAVVAYLNANK